ncbi:hypothetical protein ASE09_07610 [Streptomyces sp. Root66D1]|nr:hypothetical protein ASD33_07605 [Streptomyces sp. Root1304]KRA90610.1 hypothetical protein ASE09_07610 [Streptomyces sp. Root66D1]
MAGLPLYAFALFGLTIGLLPMRRLLAEWAEETNRGVTREQYDWPRGRLFFLVVCVVGASLAALAFPG